MLYFFSFTEFPFDFAFLIQLRLVVHGENCLAEIIQQQHPKLRETPKELIQSILEGKTNHRVLLIMDGYDEYRHGTNSDIDNAIESKIGNCLLLLTSRPELSSGDEEHIRKRIRNHMDGEVVIEGFSEENVIKCGSQYLGSKEKCKDMIKQAQQTGIKDLLHVPIILLMTSVLFHLNNSLPQTQTEIFKTVRDLIMDRATLKRLNCKSLDIANLKEKLNILGEFSWKALQSDIRQLLLDKVKCSFNVFLNQ